MPRRSLEDIIAHADELAEAFENYDPKPEDLNAPLPPTMAVKLAAWRRDVAEKELAEAIQAAREDQVSWRELGEAIGMSGEAVRQRYNNDAAEPQATTQRQATVASSQARGSQHSVKTA